jgi:hypothetical protein
MKKKLRVLFIAIFSVAVTNHLYADDDNIGSAVYDDINAPAVFSGGKPLKSSGGDNYTDKKGESVRSGGLITKTTETLSQVPNTQSTTTIEPSQPTGLPQTTKSLIQLPTQNSRPRLIHK